jgi:glycosyltransferase involved in cell wall biosynthesis
MEVVVNVDQRFERTPDGAVWTYTQFPYAFWRRYLDVFDSVRVVARALDVDQVGDDALRVDGKHVVFHELPFYHGLKQYLQRAGDVQSRVRKGVQGRQAVILRINSSIASWMRRYLHSGRPFGAEVVTDPWDIFSPGAFPHPLRPLLRRYYARQMRQLCRQAAATSYVTRDSLQRRYPPAPDKFTNHCSDVDVSLGAFQTQPRVVTSGPSPLGIITVGGLSQMYKGVDTLIDACAACLRDGVDVTLTVLGDGRHQPALEQRAQATGFGNKFAFRGAVATGEPVRRELDASDLFVLPSRVEGLPRAMIEAMARGLPCIGTHVGGIPELLAASDRVERDDVPALAQKIREVAADPARMTEMSQRNLAVAADYRDDLLHRRRIEFYTAVRQATEAWSTKQFSGAATSEAGGRAHVAASTSPTEGIPK